MESAGAMSKDIGNTSIADPPGIAAGVPGKFEHLSE
jgi:hypothetical protein